MCQSEWLSAEDTIQSYTHVAIASVSISIDQVTSIVSYVANNSHVASYIKVIDMTMSHAVVYSYIYTAWLTLFL